MTEETAPPPPPRSRGSGYRSLLHPIVESDKARPPLYKSFYDEFPEKNFSKNRFTMLRNYLFWKNVVIDRPLCGWTSLFNIKESVYPELVKEFYANMYYHNGLISSYVRRRNVYLDAERISEILGYTNDGLTVYTSGKWDPALNLSYHDTLACICTRISLSDGFTPTHKSLGPVYAQLDRIITYIILPQSGSYQKVSFCDTLVLFALIMRVKISFAYLMMRYMHDCIKGDQNTALPYGMFLTKVLKAFFVNLDNEPYEAKYSHLKGGGVVKRAAKRDLRAERRALEEEERRARASTSRLSKSKGSGIKLLVTIVRELIQKVINIASCTSTAMEKSKSRARVLEKYLNKLEDDHLFLEPEEEEDEEEHQDSQGEDDSDAN
ncbi:hypothetical protein PIB30_080370 [Stylosanthes scabra]|uniref:Putative plant transposon protein domain-containing protein n=1 Tax=Stylosanthes scabra TaxID=79078 RepID=A0ABU6VRP4_9FABA|nr:hypothetical protein [Stylosanthes scabra]